MEKAVSVLNRISTVLFVIILLLVYAYLPIQVELNVEGLDTVHKQRFFYYALFAFIIVNLLLRVILTFGFRSSKVDIAAWLRGLIFVLNFYMTLIMGFIGVLNNATHVSPSSYAYLNFLGPILLVGWVVGLVVVIVKQRSTV